MTGVLFRRLLLITLALLAAHLRYGELQPAATLQTRRVGVRVVSGERSLADVTLDSVKVLGDAPVWCGEQLGNAGKQRSWASFAAY